MPHPELLRVSLDPDPVIEAYKKGVDQTLVRENLKLSTQQRVDKMLAALRFAEEVRASQRSKNLDRIAELETISKTHNSG